MPINLGTDIADLPRVGEKLTKRLHKLGLFTVTDLLYYFPFRYEDFSTITPIVELQPNSQTTIRGTVSLIANKRAFRRRMYITECLITDESASITAVWFNQPFITRILKHGDTAYFSGKVEQTPYGLHLTSPTYEVVKKEQTHTARIVPVYSLTENITEKQVRYLVKLVLPLARAVPDWLPADLLKEHKLIPLNTALREIHFPTNLKTLEQAQRRLKFNELLLIQLRTQRIRHELSLEEAPAITFNQELTQRFVRSLPFTLTENQRRVAWQMLGDLNREHPMNRLLQGDVGSGKTVVATLLAINVTASGYQIAVMAPTEILASQHYKTFIQLLGDKHGRIALYTRTNQYLDGASVPAKTLLHELALGKIAVIIGTHALIQEKANFNKLGLVVIDEQHRFGVDQRKLLKRKSGSTNLAPHLLSMTATPIPRTLALTLYGDLDLSTITEMPVGRKRIITKIVPPEKRTLAYDFIAEEIKKGRQVFVICPLISESDKLGVKAATAEYERLSREVFPELTISLLHGKLAGAKKDAVMQDFAANKTNILVATSVVEVGIDVPNASVMVIEGAERFGLAQLHQLRGRVGRAEHQSYCLVFTDSDTEKTVERLEALVTAKNGFELAEKDLEFRGPGVLYGVQQSGFPDLKIATLADTELIELTKKAAAGIFSVDPKLENYPALREKMRDFGKSVHLE